MVAVFCAVQCGRARGGAWSWLDSQLSTFYHHPHHHHHHTHLFYCNLGSCFYYLHHRSGHQADVDELQHSWHKFGHLNSSITLHHHGNSSSPLPHVEELSTALDNLFSMRTVPSNNTCIRLLKACIKHKSLSHAKQIHTQLVHFNIPLSGLLGDYLVVTLAKCGALGDALEVLTSLSHRTVYSWTALISAFVENGCGQVALKLHKCMLEDGVGPNHFTFVSLFRACGMILDLGKGKSLHDDARSKGFIHDLFVGNSLVSMYAKCGAIQEAEHVFLELPQRDIVSWNTMLSVYVEQFQASKAIMLYRQMHKEDESPDRLTFMSALQACTALGDQDMSVTVKGWALGKPMALEIGRALHADAHKRGQTSDIMVGTALIRMYGKFGLVENAEDAFMRLPHQDTMTWNALLGAYVEQGLAEKALHFCILMHKQSVILDEVSCMCCLQACSELGSLVICNHLLFTVVCAGCESVHSMAACIIQAYRGCASMLDAQSLLNLLSEPDYITWTTCIAGHAGDGQFGPSLHTFDNLGFTGFKPDEVLFTAILSACSHTGLPSEGLEYFISLSIDYGMTPHFKHYSVMLDLFGRVGDFKKVCMFLKLMPMQADLSMLVSLLGACRTHGHVELAKQAFDCVVRIEPYLTFAYILMSNIYVDAGMHNCAVDVEIARHNLGAGMTSQQSLLEDEVFGY